MAYETINLSIEDRVGTIALSRPGKLNAFTTVMRNELLDAFDALEANDDVRAIIVTGAGSAFCAGADISEGASGFVEGDGKHVLLEDGSLNYSSPQSRDGGGLVTLRIFQLKKPVIGAINGAAVGIGATMTLPMDVRLASDKARFGFVFAKRGIVPEAASSWFLPRVVGISQALDWCFSGRIFDAQEALTGGLVSRVVAHDDLLEEAKRIALEYADRTAPVSIALTRQMMWRGLGMADPMEAHRVDSRGVLSRSQSADAKEGVESFLEKRDPVFPQKVSIDMPDYFPWWEEPEYS